MKSFFLRFVVIPALTSLTLTSISLSIALFTAIPMEQMAARLAAGGLQIEGIHGCAFFGFHFDKVTLKNETINFTLENVEYKYGGMHQLWFSDVWTIESIAIRKGQFEGKKALPAVVNAAVGGRSKVAPRSASSPKPPSEKDNTAFDGAWSSLEQKIGKLLMPRKPKKIVFTKFDFRDIEFLEATKSMAKLNEFSVTGLEFAIETGHINLVQTVFDTNLLLVRSNGLNYDAANRKLDLSSGIDFVVKAGVSGLTKPLQVQAKGGFNFKAMDGKLELDGLNKAFKGEIDFKGAYLLQLKDFNLSEYFGVEYPVKKINLKSSGITLMAALTGLIVEGDAEIGSTSFKLMAPTPDGNWRLGYTSRDVEKRLHFVWIDPLSKVPHILRMNFASAGDIGPKMKSSYRFLELVNGSPDTVANIYYRKPMVSLTPQESASVAVNEAFLIPPKGEVATSAKSPTWMFWQGGNRVAAYNSATGQPERMITLDTNESFEAIAYDPSRQSFFLKTAKGLLDTGSKTVIPVSNLVASAFARARTMTFDSVRQRVVLVGGQDGSQLIEYDVPSKSWRLLDVLALSGVREIHYDSSTDRFWMLRQAKGQALVTDLLIYRNDLKPERRQILKNSSILSADFSNANMVVVASRLLVQTLPAARAPASAANPAFYIIDLSNGDTRSLKR